MSLDGVGFGEGEGRFPSMISLKLLFPTFLASWVGAEETGGHSQMSPPPVRSASLPDPPGRLTKSSEVPSLSSSMDWMREMWTPISRWIPEHSMQVRIPRLVDSHLGSGTGERHHDVGGWGGGGGRRSFCDPSCVAGVTF